jgi:hypothetical protein
MRRSGCARSVAGELSWVSNVASFSGKFGDKPEVTCGGVKDISGSEASVNNLESGVVRLICVVGEAESEDIRGSTEGVSLEAGTGEDDDGMSGKATIVGRVSDSELSIGEMTGVSA